MNYCQRCVMPDTKPFIEFNSHGICSACLAHEQKKHYLNGIDWKERQKSFEDLVLEAKQRKAPFYDVLVPVSGGKDSISQVHKALEHQLRVLAVNVDYGIKTDIGRRNLNLIPPMGVTLVTVRPEQHYHNQMIKIGFEDFGDPDLMSHALLFCYPMWTAVNFSVPMVWWGENSAFEYGGDKISGQKSCIDREWFYKYVVTRGITTKDMHEHYQIPLDVLNVYDFPQEQMQAQNITPIFLGYYFYWDSQINLSTAKKYGFQELTKPREGTFRKYVGIDEKINRIHQYMKVLKFGYGRATDHACEDIRNGRISREEAIELVAKYDVQPLSSDYVEDFCALLGYTEKQFWGIMDKYCAKNICEINEDGGLTVCGHEQLKGVKVWI